MAIDKTSQTIKLKDGRLLGYAEYGAPHGKPVFSSTATLARGLISVPTTQLHIRWAPVSLLLIGQGVDFLTSNQAERYWIGLTMWPSWRIVLELTGLRYPVTRSVGRM